jgi:hypothetical protein
MFLKLPQIDVSGNTVDNIDLLDRKRFTKQLTDLVDRIDDPFVMALDGGWGTGKTFFLKMWCAEHNKVGGKATIIYFDAFAHDFLNDPLASLVLRLEHERAAGQGDAAQAMKKIKDATKKLVFPVARIGAALASLGASEALAGAAQATSAELETLYGSFWSSEETRISEMLTFRDSLQELAQDGTLVFVVDELDRCRPDYALSLLEIVKHFFEVPKVHFILGTNISALKTFVKLRYGGGVNADIYLQKFVNVTMTLPEADAGPATAQYVEQIIKRLRENNHYLASRVDLLNYFQEISKFATISSRLNLRSVEAIFNRLALLPEGLDKRKQSEQLLAVFSAVIEVIDRELFISFLNGTADADAIIDLAYESEPHDQSKATYLSRALQALCNHVLGNGGDPEFDEQLKIWYFSDVLDNNYGRLFRRRLHDDFTLFRST